MIKYWWSEDRQWFCIRIKGETVSLTVAEAEELMGEVQQTPGFLKLQEDAYQRAIELMEQSCDSAQDGSDIVERLRFDATRCELQFSKGVASNINDAAGEIERLRGQVRLSDNLLSGLTGVVEGLKAELAEHASSSVSSKDAR